MAGTKNINIVYNVDTQSIQVAKQQVDQARVATDQLNQSAQNLGNTGSTGARKFSNYIEGLRLQMQQLKAQIELTSQTDTVTLNQRIALYKEMQAQMDKYTAGLKDTKTQTDLVGNSLNGLYSTVKTVLTAGLIKETISAALEMAKLAGQVQGVKAAFDRIPNSTLLMEDLRQKTHGTIDELTLMQTALKAQNFKIPLDQLGTLLEFASIKAQQTGQDINYLTDSLINGLGRNSIRLLDNLQISVTELREKTKELGSTQAAVFSIINKQMSEMNPYLETSATDVKQLDANWKQFNQTLATSMNQGGVLSFIPKLLNDATIGATNLIKVLNVMSKTGMSFNEASKAVFDYNEISKQAANTVNTFTKSHKDDSDAIDNEIKRLQDLMTTNKQVINSFKQTPVVSVGNILGVVKEQNMTDEELQARKDNQKYYSEQINLLTQYRESLDNNNKPQLDQIGLIEALDQKIKQLNEDLKNATSQKQIISIKVQIDQAEAEKANLLIDPIEQGKKAKAAFDNINQQISDSLHESAKETIQKTGDEYDKGIKALYKQLTDDNNKSFKQWLAGLKLQHKEEEQEQQDHQNRVKKILSFAGQQLYTNARQIANELIQKEVSDYDNRIQALQDYYSQQETLAGSNSKRVAQLQQEEAAKQKVLEKQKSAAQKRSSIQRIEIDTAANVVRSILENGGVPLGLPFGGIAAAMGLAQIALVNSYAKGVIDLKGPGTETSDSIPSLLSKGESVMTAEETRNSGNILRSIRAKKLNDEVLDRLTVTTEGITANFDDSRIVNELRRNKQPDIVRQFSTIYEAKEVGKNMKRIIRSKSFNN